MYAHTQKKFRFIHTTKFTEEQWALDLYLLVLYHTAKVYAEKQLIFLMFHICLYNL